VPQLLKEVEVLADKKKNISKVNMEYNGKKWNQIGSGASGTVYGHNREVLKVSNSNMSNEVKIMKNLKNLNFVPKVIRKYNNHHFTMTRVPGETLSKLKGTLSNYELHSIREQLRNHIEKFKLVGIIHGNLHDANIIFDKSSGKVYIIDFGSAYSKKRKIGYSHSINTNNISVQQVVPLPKINIYKNAQNNLAKVTGALTGFFPFTASPNEKKNLIKFLLRFRHFPNQTKLVEKITGLRNGSLPEKFKGLGKKNYKMNSPAAKRTKTTM